LGSLAVLVLALTACTNQVMGCCEGNSCNCEPNCWERCFNSPSNPSEKQAYIRIYEMAMGIRSLYAPCFKPHGTAYMLDADVPISSTPQLTYQYQRDLASIIGQVQPVGNDCNPFCTSKFHQNFAYYASSWACKSRCEIYNHFHSPWVSSFNVNSGPSWVGGGKILADHCFKNSGLSCTECASNELIIAFANSRFNNFYPNTGWCNGPSDSPGQPFYCAAVGTGNANWYNMATLMGGPSGSIYLMPENNVNRNAAAKINKCIYNQCCVQSQSLPYTWSTMNREAQSPAVDRKGGADKFGYSSSSSQGKVQQFAGSYEDFEKKILDPILNGKENVGPQPVRG